MVLPCGAVVRLAMGGGNMASEKHSNLIKIFNVGRQGSKHDDKNRDSLQNRQTKSDHRIMQPFARPNTRAWPRDSVLGKILDFDPTLKIWLIRFFVHVPSPRPSPSPLVPSILNWLCFHPNHFPLEPSTFNPTTPYRRRVRTNRTRVHCTVYLVLCILHRVPCTLYIAPCTMHRASYIVYHVPCNLVHCIPCTWYRAPHRAPSVSVHGFPETLHDSKGGVRGRERPAAITPAGTPGLRTSVFVRILVVSVHGFPKTLHDSEGGKGEGAVCSNNARACARSLRAAFAPPLHCLDI